MKKATLQTDGTWKVEVMSVDEEKDINECDEDELCDIAWDYVLKNPEKYRTCEPDYDNENILEQSITEEENIQ